MRYSSSLRKTTSGKRQLEENIIQTKDDFIENYSKDHKKRRTLFFQLADHQISSQSKYISTKDFKDKIDQCLNELKEKAPHYSGLFCLFNKKVRATDQLA